jgi:uncharacterized protein
VNAGPRLLCDEMLQRLGRWLRAAGYDTAIADGGKPDADLLKQASDEGRILLTRDRGLAMGAGSTVAVVELATDELDAAARALRDGIGIDWLRAPFTRCLVDNAALHPARPAEWDRLPGRIRGLAGPLTTCPRCGRIYWPGGHQRRMRTRLEQWRRT